jgi:hypothetical protein
VRCDEYLRSDAKARSGASLGRLLNLCDGRCLSQVEFEPLGPAEAARWLGTGTAAPEAPLTLARLYALREHRPGSTATDQPGATCGGRGSRANAGRSPRGDGLFLSATVCACVSWATHREW